MSIQPLLSHPPLVPGESLPSLLARLAKLNSYEPRRILFTLIRELGKVKDNRGLEKAKYSNKLGCPSQITLFECIGALTTNALHELYKATAHYFTPILTPPENEIEYLDLAHGLSVPLLSKGIAHRQVRPEKVSQFCPQCLKVAVYQRLVWLPFASAACLEHKCLLVNSCPKCGKQIGIQDIIEASCSRCKTNLKEVQTISLENDCFGLFTQSLIQSWLMEGISPTTTFYPLPQQMPRDLYRVIDGMRLSIRQVTQDWPLLHHVNIQQSLFRLLPAPQAGSLTPYQSYCLYATACKAIIDWPNGFYQFLTAYRNREKRSRYRNHPIENGIGDELGYLYLIWLNQSWKQPTLEFVQKAFNQYLIDNQISFPATKRLTRYKDTPQLIDNLCYVSQYEAAKLLGVTPRRLRFMTLSGQLKTYSERDKPWATLVKREDIMELRETWEQAIGLEEVMDWLGLSEWVIPRLVHVGLLAAQQLPTNRLDWKFSPLAVTECLERILWRAQRYTDGKNGDGEKMLSLNETSRFLRLKLPSGEIAFILQEVAEGRLRAYIPQHQKLLLGTLLFSRHDVETYIEAVKAEKGWIGRDEAARILEIGGDLVATWERVGLISPLVTETKSHYFERSVIEKFKSDLVRCIGASEILGVHPMTVLDLVRQGRIEAISGPGIDGGKQYIFSRQSLLKWKSTRLPKKEVSQLLHISRKQIVDWVKQGKLPLPEDEQQTPWFFSVQDLRVYGYTEPEQETSSHSVSSVNQA